MYNFLIFISMISFFSRNALAQECAFLSEPQIIFRSTHEIHKVWIEKDAGIFESKKMPNSNSLFNYLSAVKNKIPDINPYSLLKKEYNDFMASDAPELVAEASNMSLALTGQAGAFHSLNCLEALLLNEQAIRGLSWDRPMEFSSFILKSTVDSKFFF